MPSFSPESVVWGMLSSFECVFIGIMWMSSGGGCHMHSIEEFQLP